MSDAPQAQATPPLTRLPQAVLKRLGKDLERVLIYLFLVGATAIPISVVVVVSILKAGHTTIFPPDDPHVGWVDGSETRGTFNVIWVCITTIFTCVYVSVHVGIPKRTETGSRTWRFITHPGLRKVYWVFFNIFAPELMVLVALCERESAKSGIVFMQKFADSGTRWNLRHAFFADMGGFKLRGEDGRVFHTGLQFYEWVRDHRPNLDYKEIERDIKDRSKKDMVLKVFTCAQAAWFLLETIVRFVQHQPVSELEVTTCSYIVCAIITHVCWLHKPYGVNRPISVHSNNVLCNDPRHTIDWKHASTSTSQSFEGVYPPFASMPVLQEGGRIVSAPDSISNSFPEDKEKQDIGKETQAKAEVKLPRTLFPTATCTPFNRAYYDVRHSILNSCLAACAVGIIVGIMHIIPFWDTPFVNTEGQRIWRICCSIQTSIFVAFAFIAFIEPWFHNILLWMFPPILCMLYCISRTVLFALIWVSFASQPVGLYRSVSWEFGVIPHWD